MSSSCDVIAPVEQRAEWAACQLDPFYFLDRYCHVYDATAAEWVPFRLWAAQVGPLDLIDREQLVCILKARQLGMTWLVLGYILWRMIFWPACTALVFSKREEEAIYLLGDERLRGMWRRLPKWMQVPSASPAGAKAWALANGSICRAFPSNAGDSYTATLALVDEADLVPDLGNLLSRVKPTIDAGGKLILLSRADKSRPESAFKRVYRAAKAGRSPWKQVFLPWHSHPGRDALWYEAKRKDIMDRTGSLDELHEQYPATDTEALAPRSLDKRITSSWLERCYVECEPLRQLPDEAPSIPGLVVFKLPEPGRRYAIGGDTAEGNPTSDDSAATVLDAATGEEVANLVGKLQPSTFGAHLDALAAWYNDAGVMVERNNHGHAVLLWLQSQGSCQILLSPHDRKMGWLSSAKGKVLLYNAAADAFRHGETMLHDFATFTQLSSIEGSTLRAPEGEHDDRADSYALALVACPIVLTMTEE